MINVSPSILLDELKPVLQAIPQQPQTRVSLSEQLLALSIAAQRLGLYDAQDWIMALYDNMKQSAKYESK